ncbi:uncharacterized protein PV09_02545 [Verruconis gallopava]|uniref:Beta-glucuronidase C-terminal domain-containing protein n=1 Tax=Verruconis gallopava TaxID=253628 RepID=A0A0D2B6K2_9PEZI|nr:uncharacterized protein PV09_02545 [Verruconis gallopava]KIW06869.1 hypothetical protein PV09_02545 [Verruconis gallopava]
MELRLPVALILLSFATSTYAQTISPASSASGAGASGPLDPSFAGFGIEPSNIFSFTGGSSANELSVNLLQNLADYSGAPPHIRLGGNTGDYMVYNSSYTSYDFQTNGNNIYSSSYLTFGDALFKAINRFPTGTPITFGLNLAYEESDYIANIVREAQAVLDNIGHLTLYSFEIGNEPDLYAKNGFRQGAWDGQIYTQEFLERASAISEQVLKPAGYKEQFFESPATASTIGTTFTIDDLVSYGITKGTNGSGNLVSGWNQHDYFYFVDVSTYGLTLDHLMELSNTESQFAYWVTEVTAGLATGLPYYLREMASAGPTGLPNISNTFGAALWTLNFFCYAATLNISSVEMHMTDNSYAAAWMPISRPNSPTGVRPSYYAFAAMAQLIGSGNGTTQIAAVTPSGLPSEYTTYVRSYAAYTGSSLSAVVIINGMQANISTTNKGGVTFELKNLPAGQELYISELTADGADATAGTTWNGISFEDSDNGTPKTVNKTISTITISNSGTASVYVRDSQAVIANIGFQLGTRDVTVAGGTSPSTKKPSLATSTGQGAKNAVLLALLITAALAVFDFQC